MKDGFETGEYGWRMGPFAMFQADTELMASEILKKKTQPEQLAKIIPLLADKPLKKKAAARPAAAQNNNYTFPDDDLSDCPF